MKPCRIISVLAFLFITSFYCKSANSELLDRIIAVVGEEPILFSELNEMVFFTLQQSGRNLSSITPEELNNFRKLILKNMIQEKILAAQAEAESLTVKKEEIIKQRDAHVNKLLENYGSPEELDIELNKIYGVGLQKLKQRLYKQYADEFLKMQLKQKLVREIKLTKSEIEDFYSRFKDSLPMEPNSINVGHIMVKVKPSDVLEKLALEKIKVIQNELSLGKSFDSVAAIYSDDPGTRDKGGDLGFFIRGEMDPTFEQAAFELNVNQTSKPVRSQFGFHIIKLTERRQREIRAKHILVMVRPGQNEIETAINLLDSIRSLSSNDSLFSLYAAQFSHDKLSKIKGGELGWLPENELDISYSAIIKTLEVGEISKPEYIKSTNAVHIFRLKDRKESRKYTLAQDWEKINQFATNYKLSNEIEKLVKEWQNKIYVENRLDQELSNQLQ
ncbi:MAG: peptidylprolyl isomerase [bacterium]